MMNVKGERRRGLLASYFVEGLKVSDVHTWVGVRLLRQENLGANQKLARGSNVGGKT